MDDTTKEFWSIFDDFEDGDEKDRFKLYQLEVATMYVVTS